MIKKEELHRIEKFAKYIDRACQTWDGESVADLYRIAHTQAMLDGCQVSVEALERAIVSKTIDVLKGNEDA